MMKTTNPKQHQALGRKAKGFDRVKWDEREYCTDFCDQGIVDADVVV